MNEHSENLSPKYMEGDLLSIQHGIICHQVNCRHVMGAGLAAQIKKRYPRHYADYMARYAHLGSACITEISPGKLYVAGIYGQDGYGRTGVHTQYPALKKGLERVVEYAAQWDLPVYLPFGIGCGLAGGDWHIVSGIIQEVAPNAIIIKKSKGKHT